MKGINLEAIKDRHMVLILQSWEQGILEQQQGKQNHPVHISESPEGSGTGLPEHLQNQGLTDVESSRVLGAGQGNRPKGAVTHNKLYFIRWHLPEWAGKSCNMTSFRNFKPGHPSWREGREAGGRGASERGSHVHMLLRSLVGSLGQRDPKGSSSLRSYSHKAWPYQSPAEAGGGFA